MAPLPRLLPRIVRRNWRLKVAAFVLALVAWALVRAEPSRRGDVFAVPVEVQVGDLGWALAADPTPAIVEVRFRGPTSDLIRLAREGTSLRIPLDSVAAADTVVELRRDWVVLERGSGLVVEDISPASVRLRLEPTRSTLVPVRMQTTGELPDGMALALPVDVEPEFVRVRGAERRVRGIDSVRLRPLELDGLSGSGIYTMEIDTAGLDGLSVTPSSAALAVQLEPALERVLAAVPVLADLDDDADSLVIVPPTIAVRLTGARSPLAGADSAAVRAVVPPEELAGLHTGQERRVAIRLRGLPALVRGFAAVDSVTVRRVARPARGAVELDTEQTEGLR